MSHDDDTAARSEAAPNDAAAREAARRRAMVRSVIAWVGPMLALSLAMLLYLLV